MDEAMDYYEFKKSFKSDKEWKIAYANLAEEDARRLILNCKNSSYLAQTGMISTWRKLHNKYFNIYTDDTCAEVGFGCG